MRILVTGGAGFIGSHVVDHYVSLGHSVSIIDNLSAGMRSNLNPGARFYEMDISDPGIAKVFEKEQPEILNHHAAQIDVRRSVEDPSYDARVNILGSLNLLHLAGIRGVRKVIYISTGGAVYGEPQYLPCDENHPIHPISPYGISKHTVEHYLHQSSATNGLTYTVLRYSNIYGPRQNPKGEAGVCSIFVRQMMRHETPTIFGEGHECRDYVYVEDVVRANALVLERGDNEIFNLGTGKGTTVDEIYKILSGILDFHESPNRAPLRPGEVERMILDAGKARQNLGWSPQISVPEGLKRTVQFFRDHPDYL